MGKLTDTAVTTSRPTPNTSAPKVPTSEQIRMAQLLVDPKSEDHSILKDKVHKVMELCHCDETSALGALHDCDNDVEHAVDKLLEGGEYKEEWVVQEGKKKKKVQHQLNSDDLSPNMNDDFDNYGSKPVLNRRGGGRGMSSRAGTDGPPRFRGRSSGTGGGGRGTFGKENDSRVDNGGEGERGGFTRGRGRGARDGSDRGGRGRGFGGRGSRRGGGGFNQNEGSGGGFAQIDSWNAPPVADINTWDNSMANTVSNAGPAAAGNEWGKRNSNNTGESNTWNNSMTQQQANNDYDWGGEENWSKIRDGGLVVESSAAHKVTDKSFSFMASSTTAAQQPPITSPHVLSSNDAARVRGESIDVNSLFAPNQAPTSQQQQPQQQPQQSTSSWTTSKQATADLKNELGIGKVATATHVNSDSASHLHHNNRNSVLPKSNLKVQLPLGRTSAPTGPIDVQFGDMTLISDTSQALFDFNVPTTELAPTPEERNLPQSQMSALDVVNAHIGPIAQDALMNEVSRRLTRHPNAYKLRTSLPEVVDPRLGPFIDLRNITNSSGCDLDGIISQLKSSLSQSQLGYIRTHLVQQAGTSNVNRIQEQRIICKHHIQPNSDVSEEFRSASQQGMCSDTMLHWSPESGLSPCTTSSLAERNQAERDPSNFETNRDRKN